MTCDQYERQKVHEWRSKARYPWSAIARNLGRSVEDVRRDHDLTYFPNLSAAPAREAPVVRTHRPGTNATQAAELDVLELFYEADRPIKLTSLTTRLRSGLSRLRLAYGRDIIGGYKPDGVRITERGREVYRRLKDGSA